MNPVWGITLKLLSVAVFMLMSVCIKATGNLVPPGQVVFFRSAFAIPVILAWIALAGGGRAALGVVNPMGHFWRGLVGCTAMGLSFTALGLLPLPEITAIGYAAPLLVVIFAAMFLGERIRVYRIGAVALGLAGVLVVLSPRLSVLEQGGAALEALGAMLMLMSTVFIALASVFIRKLTLTEQTAAIVFYFSVNCTVLSLITLPWGWVWPQPGHAALLVAAGLLGGLAQILMTEAYRHAEAAVVAPFEYASMLLALGFGYFVFAEVPTGATLSGAGLVMIAGLIIIWRERANGIAAAKARKVMTPQG